MKVRKPWRKGHAIAMAATLLLLSLLTFSPCTAQQSSTFGIAGWTGGEVPVFSGSGMNTLNLSHGDSLMTNILFQGTADDGLGADPDNVAFMNFAYTYTIYLTPVGQAFSSSSIAIGTHTVNANQTCSSNIIPPWSIGCDAQAAVNGDSVNIAIADAISGCVGPGNYQVDIVIQNYNLGSGGPHAPAVQLQWIGYDSPSGTPNMVTVPASTNTAPTSLSPASSYLLSQLAYVNVSKPTSCPTLTVTAKQTGINAATVTASYAGSCPQDPCTYLWSDGETGPSAVHLTPGNYSVTATTPCGNASIASVTIPRRVVIPTLTQKIAVAQNNQMTPIPAPVHHEQAPNNPAMKSLNTEGLEVANEISVSLYPNPSHQYITFDLSMINTNTAISILDLPGRMMMDNISAAEGQKTTVSIADLPAGVYIYQCTADKIYRGKFVKQ